MFYYNHYHYFISHYFNYRLYYQKNDFFSFPDECSRLYSSHHDVTLQSLSRCSSELSIYNDFFNNSCYDSFPIICNAAYTHNPPFSCERYVNPDLLTTMG